MFRHVFTSVSGVVTVCNQNEIFMEFILEQNFGERQQIWLISRRKEDHGIAQDETLQLKPKG